MPVHNAEIADKFNRYADLLEIDGANQYRVRAYRTAEPERMPESYLLPHRQKGGRCPVCGGEVKAAKISGRTAYYCPRCQK